MKGCKLIDAILPETRAAAKVVAKACSWYELRQATQAALGDEKARISGRFQQSPNELAEAVEKYRKFGARP